MGYNEDKIFKFRTRHENQFDAPECYGVIVGARRSISSW